MKNTLFSIFFITLPYLSFAQSVSDCHKEGGAFISEIGNESKADYIELTVYGSTSNPTAPVNLEGWILDDNNKIQKNVGNQTGHIRLGSCFSAVRPGTIILIYTPLYYSNKLVNKANDGFFDYNIQTNMKCLVPYLNCPNRKTKNIGYDCPPTIYSPITFWDLKELIPLYNAGDALQLRNREGELEHAIYWTNDYEEKDNPKAVNIMNKIPTPPFWTTSLNKLSVHFKADKDWLNPANYEVNSTFTLGEWNNNDHKNMIEKLKNGSFSTALKASVTVKQQPTSKDNDGVIEVNITNGVPECSVTISNATFFRIDYFKTLGTHEIRNIPSGDYKVYVGDIEDCGQLFDLGLLKTTPICASNNVCQDIGVNQQQYCKYQWKQHADITDVTKPTIRVCPKETTTYTLSVTDSDGNIKELNYTVEVKTAELSQTMTLYCGNDKEITVKGKNPIWKHGPTTNTITIKKDGIYEVTVTDDSNCLVSGKVEVLSGNVQKNIKKYFRALGFFETADVIKDIPPALVGNNSGDRSVALCDVTDHTKATSVYLDGNEVKLRQEFLDLCQNGSTNAEQFHITENENFCTFFDVVEKDYLSGKKTFWTHKYLDDENVLFVNKNFLLDNYAWYPLTKNLLKSHVDSHCIPNISLENFLGNIFELTYHEWAKNYIPFNNYRINPITFPSSINRKTKPDGISDIDYYRNNTFVTSFAGSQWHECKNKNNKIYLSTDQLQIRGHVLNLALDQQLFINIAKADNKLGPILSIITPCRVRLAPSIKKVANPLGIEIEPLFAYYRYNSQGKMEVNFMTIDYSFANLFYTNIVIPFGQVLLQVCN